MPVIFREAGFRFHFFSREDNPLEPVHVHAARPGGDAKRWLYPEVRVAYKRRLSARELRELEAIVTRHRQEIEDAWNALSTGSDTRQI